MINYRMNSTINSNCREFYLIIKKHSQNKKMSRLVYYHIKSIVKYSECNPKLFLIPILQKIFSMYGFIWFVLGDFCPRGASSFFLALLMRQSENNIQEVEKSKVDKNVRILPFFFFSHPLNG